MSTPQIGHKVATDWPRHSKYVPRREQQWNVVYGKENQMEWKRNANVYVLDNFSNYYFNWVTKVVYIFSMKKKIEYIRKNILYLQAQPKPQLEVS